MSAPMGTRASLSRFHGEVYRRIRAVAAFPNRASGLRRMTAVPGGHRRPLSLGAVAAAYADFAEPGVTPAALRSSVGMGADVW